MKRLQDVLLSLLVVGVVAQTWIVFASVPAGGNRPALPEAIGVGDELLLLTGYAAPGEPITVSLDDETASATVIYSFHPDCAYSAALGSRWARHFDESQQPDVGVRRIAVTVDSPSAALDFAKRLGWRAEVISVAGLSPLRREYSLVSRTPWVFVFDSSGVLQRHVHGSEIGAVEAAVSRLLPEEVAWPDGTIPGADSPYLPTTTPPDPAPGAVETELAAEPIRSTPFTFLRRARERK